MHPFLELPGVGLLLRSYNLMFGVAVTAALLASYWWTVHSEGLDRRRVRWALVLVALVSLVGARLHFVLAHWSLYAAAPWRALGFSAGAFHAPGGIAGAVLGGIVVLRLLRLSFGRFLDGVAPATCLALVIMRLGCFLHGCCFGKESTLPWACSLPARSGVFRSQVAAGLLSPNAAHSLPVHPLPLYFAAAALAIMGLLLWLRPRRRYAGQVGLLMLVLVPASSALLEPLRFTDPHAVYWGPFPQLLWVNGVLAATSFLLLLAVERRTRAARPVAAVPVLLARSVSPADAGG